MQLHAQWQAGCILGALGLLAPLCSPAQNSERAPEGAAPAVEAESLKGVELKGRVPVNPNTLEVRLPRPAEAVLANGLRVALLEDRKLPTFSLQLIFTGGGLADPPEQRGLALVTAAMLREGTAQRSSREIAEELAALGASLSSGASLASGESSVGVSGSVEHLDAILAVVADVVRNPVFPPHELDKFVARYFSQLEHQRATPGFLAQEQFMQAVYGEHPAGTIVPSERALRSIASADLAKYHAAHYRPNNAILVASGDIALADLMAKLERVLGSWPKAEVMVPGVPQAPPPAAGAVHRVDRPGSVQTSLLVGGLGIERDSPDYFPVLLMNHILGGGPASRLFMNLREDKGYTYGVSSTFGGSKFAGVMRVSTSVRTEVTEPALRELLAEIRRMSTEPVRQQELEDAKRALVGRFALSLESPQGLIGNLLLQKLYDLPADYWDTYPRHVDAVTARDIQRVAATYYDPDRLQIVAVGDASSWPEALAQYPTEAD